MENKEQRLDTGGGSKYSCSRVFYTVSTLSSVCRGSFERCLASWLMDPCYTSPISSHGRHRAASAPASAVILFVDRHESVATPFTTVTYPNFAGERKKDCVYFRISFCQGPIRIVHDWCQSYTFACRFEGFPLGFEGPPTVRKMTQMLILFEI